MSTDTERLKETLLAKLRCFQAQTGINRQVTPSQIRGVEELIYIAFMDASTAKGQAELTDRITHLREQGEEAQKETDLAEAIQDFKKRMSQGRRAKPPIWDSREGMISGASRHLRRG